MESILEQAQLWLAHYGMQVIGAIAILVLGILAAKTVTKIFRKVLRRAKVDETLVSFGGNMLQIRADRAWLSSPPWPGWVFRPARSSP